MKKHEKNQTPFHERFIRSFDFDFHREISYNTLKSNYWSYLTYLFDGTHTVINTPGGIKQKDKKYY